MHKNLLLSIPLVIRESSGRSSFYHFLSQVDEPFASESQEFVLTKHAPEKGTDYLVIPFLVWITCQP